jgi:hypothetical protein
MHNPAAVSRASIDMWSSLVTVKDEIAHVEAGNTDTDCLGTLALNLRFAAGRVEALRALKLKEAR